MGTTSAHSKRPLIEAAFLFSGSLAFDQYSNSLSSLYWPSCTDNTELFNLVFLAIDLDIVSEASKKRFIIAGHLDRALNGEFNAMGPLVFPDGLKLEHTVIDNGLIPVFGIKRGPFGPLVGREEVGGLDPTSQGKYKFPKYPDNHPKG